MVERQESGRIVAEVTRNIGCCSMAAVTGGREHSPGCVNHVATDKPAPAAVKVPYEAREAGLAALNNDKDWHKPDSAGVWRANYHRAVELVLEAAAPLMGQPATGVTEQAVEAARRAYSEACKSTWPLTAAGRFRAALEAAQPYMGVRPVASADDVDALFWEHRTVASNGTQTVCACDRKWRSDTEHRTHLRDRVMNLLPGVRPVVDREAVWRGIYSAVIQQLNPSEITDIATDAVMKQLQPRPTREQVDELLQEWRVGPAHRPFDPDFPNELPNYRRKLRNAVMDLLTGGGSETTDEASTLS